MNLSTIERRAGVMHLYREWKKGMGYHPDYRGLIRSVPDVNKINCGCPPCAHAPAPERGPAA